MKTKSFIFIQSDISTGIVIVYQIENNIPLFKKEFEIGAITADLIKYILLANYIEPEDKFHVLVIKEKDQIEFGNI